MVCWCVVLGEGGEELKSVIIVSVWFCCWCFENLEAYALLCECFAFLLVLGIMKQPDL